MKLGLFTAIGASCSSTIRIATDDCRWPQWRQRDLSRRNKTCSVSSKRDPCHLRRHSLNVISSLRAEQMQITRHSRPWWRQKPRDSPYAARSDVIRLGVQSTPLVPITHSHGNYIAVRGWSTRLKKKPKIRRPHTTRTPLPSPKYIGA